VNNNGNTTEKVARLAINSIMNITENKNLIIDTYLVPNGGTKTPAYNPAIPSSAVGFTP
jgi:hypothetical protein